MKKNYILFLTFFCVVFGYSQTNLLDLYGNSNPEIYSTTNENDAQAACSQSVLSNALENGGLFGGATNQIIAVDIDVAAGETFTISEIKPVLIDAATYVDVTFYSDNAGLPGTELITLSSVPISSSTVIGQNFGYDFIEYTLTLTTPYALTADVGTVTKFWMQLNSDALAWESSTVAATGLLGAFANDNTAGAWTIGTSDYVYEVSGDCSLSIESRIEDLVSVYPNPTKDNLFIKIPNSIQISKASLYNVLGQDTGLNIVNGAINTSQLTNGIYLLRIESSHGTLTKKIVKN
jgi:hypothetical protein